MMSGRLAGLFLLYFAFIGAVLLGRTVLGTGAYYTDSKPGSIGGEIGRWSPPPVPPTPPECEGMTFGQVIVGTPGDDVIDAGNGGALVFGLGGNDTITGGNGKDCLVGGDGNDTIYGGNGKDVLLGGEGNDTLYGGGDADVIEAGNGKDLLDGGDGTDVCNGTRKDTFVSCETGPTGSGANPVAPTAAPTSGTPTADPSLGPTATPDATGTADPNSTPSPTAGPTASSTPAPTAAPDPTDTPIPAATPDPTPAPAPTATSGATSTPSPATSPSPEPPSVGFSYQVSGLDVTFNNTSQGAVASAWDFGDGTTSTATDPVHAYAAGGTYRVRLEITGADGTVEAMSVDMVVGP